MKQRALIAVFAMVTLLFFVNTAIADVTMDRIKRTGKIRVGWRADSTPFAFIDPSTGETIGFSVDMTHLLVEKLSEHFGKKITIEPYTVTSKTRIPMVLDGTIDIEMGSTTFTQSRNEDVDFSLIFFFSETTFLVSSNSSINSIGDLNGKRLGAAKGSSNLDAINEKVEKNVFKPNTIIEADSHADGLIDLQNNKIDAYCTDRSLLEGLRLKTPSPESWRVVDFAIAYEPYAYMMREGSSDFRDFVNNTIIWSITSGKFYEIYDRWMGTKPVKKLKDANQELIKKARNINIMVMMATILVIGFLVFLYGQRLTSKIKSLSDVADRISFGELDAEITIKSKDEIGELSNAISRMQDSIRLSIVRLRKRRGEETQSHS